ncbi:hypothetical protein A2715_02925 [Candidatus Woesebacteria bacterium RIFCSPHIGHO2_01_FULL_39_32]|uniref:Alcohol dehydrogenase n=2 Tax=Candidatus Woeseibacteriota TaxID=1752722 RepID=A0A0G0SWN0_9BACT|nr:MAG: Alcohol dehydrogenase [Candidatus Woesebacteria bacterium GW2011_GWA1_39_8]OGM05473.1 MAG: hypothetical protein A2124_04455 [Candidatus Woesebacteria bacterium GWB1_37_5]OGM24695.1 MAG: hypothetical protein A2715_02925 [Candidatus Woesebacteria bacterium RIFCSPHIGHO2_01_FULL_39_32]OGM38152.1 MAG: hypothetical protein A3F01_00700 [Candidatus Woesebacteria bacterium RIFCSPHIGHO2_12_FULL_38_11]OGM64521.1 MAG: hypothetical protein A2893_05840 [Candidatus Woesebacteria bacterium RIFCSPLOWO2_
MKAVYFEKFGGPEVLKYGEIPTPKPKKGEALIKVKACALNHVDLHVRRGLIKIPLPHIPGCDVSGTVQKIKGKSKFLVGDEVIINPSIPCGECRQCKKGKNCEIVTIFGYGTQGGYAEYVTAPLEQLYQKPKNLSFVEAAAFPLTFLTAWRMLKTRANIQKGETIFIWGASGGLGAAAVQIAKYLGVYVIVATKSSFSERGLKKLGADYFVNYVKGDVTKKVKKLTNNLGVDVVFETVGKATWDRTLSMLKPHGRVVISGTTSGAVASQDLSDVYYYQQTILGSRMGYKDEFEEILKLVNQGKLKPVIDKIFPLKDVAKAQQRMESRKHFGKIVLEIK